MTACEAMTVARVERATRAMNVVLRHQVEEHLMDLAGIGDDQRALAEIVEQQARHDEAEPGHADRPAAEMAHVGVERLGAGDGQHDRAEGPEDAQPLIGDEAVGVDRVDGVEHGGMLGDLPQAEHAQHQEPDQHDRPEQPADIGRAARLQQEQGDQDQSASGTTNGVKAGATAERPSTALITEIGRGDDGVAVEQRQADHGQQGDGVPDVAALAVQPMGGKRRQREHAALALVVGAHDQGDVLDGDGERYRPEQHRQDAQHVLGRRRHAGPVQEGLAKGIDRAGADVAEHHPQRADDQPGGGGLVMGRSRDVGGDGRWSKGGRGHDIERRQGWRRRDGLRPRLPPVNAPNLAELRRKRLTWNRPGGGLEP